VLAAAAGILRIGYIGQLSLSSYETNFILSIKREAIIILIPKG